MKSLIEILLLAYVRKFPLRFGKYRMVEWFGHRIRTNSMRVAQLKYGGYQMECDLRKMLQRQFYFFGTYFLEERILNRWTELARNATIIFDIGANAGIYSFAAAASNSEASIHAFEPTQEIAARFKNTVGRNHLGRSIQIHPIAVAQDTGTAYLNFLSGDNHDNEGMNFVTPDGMQSESVAIPTVSLDDFCEKHGISVVDLVKIDVQGNEPDVLEGAEGLIQRKALRTIFFELNWNHHDLSHCPATRAVKILGDAGYLFADPNQRMQFREAGVWLHQLSDIVAAVRSK